MTQPIAVTRKPTNTFQTERLLFRSFEIDDLDELARINADTETSRYVGDGKPLSRDLTRHWIENSRKNVSEKGYGTGAVLLRESDELIGWTGIARPDDGSEEIIYGLYRDYWGLGLGTELLSGLLGWARSELDLSELRATVHRDNSASIAMLERQGFALAEDCYDGDPEALLYVSLSFEDEMPGTSGR